MEVLIYWSPAKNQFAIAKTRFSYCLQINYLRSRFGSRSMGCTETLKNQRFLMEMLIYCHPDKNQPARAKASFRPCSQNQALTRMILAGHPWPAR